LGVERATGVDGASGDGACANDACVDGANVDGADVDATGVEGAGAESARADCDAVKKPEMDDHHGVGGGVGGGSPNALKASPSRRHS